MNPEALPTFARLHACDFIAQTILLDSPLAKRVSSSVEVLSCFRAGAMHSKSGACDLEREAPGSLLREGSHLREILLGPLYAELASIHDAQNGPAGCSRCSRGAEASDLPHPLLLIPVCFDPCQCVPGRRLPQVRRHVILVARWGLITACSGLLALLGFGPGSFLAVRALEISCHTWN